MQIEIFLLDLIWFPLTSKEPMGRWVVHKAQEMSCLCDSRELKLQSSLEWFGLFRFMIWSNLNGYWTGIKVFFRKNVHKNKNKEERKQPLGWLLWLATSTHDSNENDKCFDKEAVFSGRSAYLVCFPLLEGVGGRCGLATTQERQVCILLATTLLLKGTDRSCEGSRYKLILCSLKWQWSN